MNVAFYAFAQCICGLFFRWVYRVQIEGRELLPAQGPYLVAANHVSYLDPPLLGSSLPGHTRFIAKEDLFTMPILGRMMRWLGSIPVHQDRVDRALLKQTCAVLQQGAAVAIFPEGERSWTGQMQPGKLGLGLLAVRARVPVVPVAILGTEQALPRGAPWLRPARLTVRIGRPIPPVTTGRPSRATYGRLVEEVMRSIANLLERSRDEQ